LSQYGVTRFGQDAPALISTSGGVLDEATELIPAEPRYGLIPFPPYPGSGIVSGTSGGTTTEGPDRWTAYPDRLDLIVYEGDDVQIPLYFQDPNDPTKDLSNENGYQWEAEIRVIHSYNSTLVNTFAVESEYIPVAEGDPLSGTTKVTLFLPRLLNTYRGTFRWELASTSPYEGPVFPIPPGVDPEEWPPTDQIKTWLYGTITIVHRLTDTDVLPPAGELPPAMSEGGSTGAWTGAFVVGPNGRVP
jgi:hypothetical protein